MSLGDNLLRFKFDQKYICLDTETCNLNLLMNNPAWSVGYELYKGFYKTGEVEEFPWSEDVAKYMSKGAAIKTRFNFAEYKAKSKPMIEVLDKVEKYLYNPDYLIVGANIGNFDIFVLNQLRARAGRKPDWSYIRRIIDIQCIEKSKELQIAIPPLLTPEYESWMWKMYGFRQRGLKTNVGFLCQKYNLSYDEESAHGAIYDVGKTMEIFFAQIKSLDIGF